MKKNGEIFVNKGAEISDWMFMGLIFFKTEHSF